MNIFEPWAFFFESRKTALLIIVSDSSLLVFISFFSLLEAPVVGVTTHRKLVFKSTFLSLIGIYSIFVSLNNFHPSPFYGRKISDVFKNINSVQKLNSSTGQELFESRRRRSTDVNLLASVQHRFPTGSMTDETLSSPPKSSLPRGRSSYGWRILA